MCFLLVAIQILFVEYNQKVLYGFLFAIENWSAVFYWVTVLGRRRIALYRQEGIRRVSPFYSLIGSTRYILLNSIVPVRLFSTSVLKKSFSFIDPYFVTGFSDAESCFNISIRNKNNSKNKVKVAVEL